MDLDNGSVGLSSSKIPTTLRSPSITGTNTKVVSFKVAVEAVAVVDGFKLPPPFLDKSYNEGPNDALPAATVVVKWVEVASIRGVDGIDVVTVVVISTEGVSSRQYSSVFLSRTYNFADLLLE